MDTIKFVLYLIIGTISDIMLICIAIIWAIIRYPLLWICSQVFILFDANDQDSFIKNVQVIGKEYKKGICPYTVYVKYRGRHYPLATDENLYKNAKIGDEISVKICIDGKGRVKSIHAI